MKKTVCLLLVFVLLQSALLSTTVFAEDSLSGELNDITLGENEVLNTFYKDTEARNHMD